MPVKKLLMIIPSLHVGGAETHLSQILPRLKAKGWDVSIYLISASGELKDYIEQQGITIITPGKLSAKLHNKHRLLRAPILALRFVNLCTYLIKSRPAIVQFMLPEAYLFGGLACILTGQKNMIMGRRSLNHYQQKHPLLTKIETWLHGKMRYIITNSQANVQQLATEEHVPLEKLKLIYNGIELQRFNSISKTANFPATPLTMIIIANIIPYKGHATLLEALAKISNQLPENWRLLCVGTKFGYVQDLENLALRLNINSNIKWLDTQSEIAPLLASSDLAISSSYEEGFSNAVIEAMAAGLPLVVTNVGGNPEAVIAGQTGLVVEPRDPQALGTAILNLVTAPAKMAVMGAAGKQRVLQNFSLETCVKNYDELYSSMLN
jgi:glycosyltransferase involved in cell wall biosynthesis